MAEAEEIEISATTKEGQYKQLVPQIKSLLTTEDPLVSNLANFSAAMNTVFNFFWVGFYTVEGDGLVLGPFQGNVACTRIRIGKGVCGDAAFEKKTKVVPDVDQYPGHIACNELSRSEIVVPVIKDGEVVAVLDVDSDKLNTFDETDQKYLEELMTWLAEEIWT